MTNELMPLWLAVRWWFTRHSTTHEALLRRR